jgi:hypothetical protein
MNTIVVLQAIHYISNLQLYSAPTNDIESDVAIAVTGSVSHFRGLALPPFADKLHPVGVSTPGR